MLRFIKVLILCIGISAGMQGCTDAQVAGTALLGLAGAAYYAGSNHHYYHHGYYYNNGYYY